MDLKTYMDYYLKNNQLVVEDLKAFSKKVNIDLVEKIYKVDDIITFHSFLSEMKFGILFQEISKTIFHDQKYSYSKGHKTPDWRFELNGQMIIAEVLRINGMTDDHLRKHYEDDYEDCIRMDNDPNYHGRPGMGTVILNSHHYYEYESKVTIKEEKYRSFINELQQPFIICIDAMGRTFLGDFDTNDFFIGNNKKGIFYSDRDFAKTVTGILLKGAFGKYTYSYFHNEKCKFDLNETNKKIFTSWVPSRV